MTSYWHQSVPFDDIVLTPECTIDKQNPLPNCTIELVHSPVTDKLVMKVSIQLKCVFEYFPMILVSLVVVVDDDDLSNAIGRLGWQTCLLLQSLFCHSGSCVDMSSLWVFIRLPYEPPRIGTYMMSLVLWQKASNIVQFETKETASGLNCSKSFFKFLRNFRQQDFFAMSAIQMIIISWLLCSRIIDGNCPIFLVIRFLFHQITNLFFYFMWNNSNG